LCGPAILGKAPLVLAPTEQRLVATWAVKTTLLMEYAYRFLGEHAYAPPSNFAYLHSRRKPPPADDTRVWIGAVGRGWRDVWHQASAFLPADDEAESSDQTGWYLATVAVGHLVLHVFGRDIQPHVSNLASSRRPSPVWNLPVAWSGHLLPIWPAARSRYISWPPPLVIPEDDLLILHPPL
jgi:hypothetical protein